MIRTKLIAPLAVITTALWLALPAAAQTAATPAARSTQQTRPTLPVIGTILEHRAALGLSASQVEALERLALDFIREAIRRQADLQIAQIDLDVVLDPEPGQTVDVKAAEAKLREIEKIRTDLQLALIRAVEAARVAPCSCVHHHDTIVPPPGGGRAKTGGGRDPDRTRSPRVSILHEFFRPARHDRRPWSQRGCGTTFWPSASTTPVFSSA
jgi:hypothetical protein